MKHYAMAMQDSFARAVLEGATGKAPHYPTIQDDTKEIPETPGTVKNGDTTVFRGPEMPGDASFSCPTRTRT